MRRLELAAAACGLWLLIVQPAVADDLTVVWNVNVPTPYFVGPKNGTLKLWMTAGKVRQSGGDRDWIYDLATRTTIVVDHRSKAYWQGPEGERRELLSLLVGMRVDPAEVPKLTPQELNEVRRELSKTKEALDEMARAKAIEDAKKFASTGPSGRPTPEERAVLVQELRRQQKELEKLAKAWAAKKELARLPRFWSRNSVGTQPRKQVGYAPTVERGTADKTIAGYGSEHYRITATRTFEDGSKKTEVELELWLSPKLEPPVSFEVLKPAPFLPGTHVAKGFPLASIVPSAGGSFHLSMVAVEIRKGPIDASVFALPAGYTRFDLPIGEVGSYSSEMR